MKFTLHLLSYLTLFRTANIVSSKVASFERDLERVEAGIKQLKEIILRDPKNEVHRSNLRRLVDLVGFHFGESWDGQVGLSMDFNRISSMEAVDMLGCVKNCMEDNGDEPADDDLPTQAPSSYYSKYYEPTQYYESKESDTVTFEELAEMNEESMMEDGKNFDEALMMEQERNGISAFGVASTPCSDPVIYKDFIVGRIYVCDYGTYVSIQVEGGDRILYSQEYDLKPCTNEFPISGVKLGDVVLSGSLKSELCEGRYVEVTGNACHAKYKWMPCSSISERANF